MTLAMTLLFLSATPAFAFGSRESGWVLLTSDGAVADRFTTIAELEPQELAISPDGKLRAFVAASSASSTELSAYVWNGDHGALTRLSTTPGYFAAPSFSPDGRWVLLAHGAGPPGKHAGKENAQVFRVPTAGGELEQLTESAGCKLAASSTSRGPVYFLHSSCHSTATLEATAKGGTLKALPDGLNLTELAVTGDGKRALVVESRQFDVALHLVDLRSGRSRPLAVLEPLGTKLRPQWSRDGRFVAIQRGRTAYRLALDGTESVLANLEQAEP